MSQISDEMLLAYVDEELDAEGRAAVEAALEADESLGQRLAAHLELGLAAKGVHADVLAEPPPERLTGAVMERRIVRPNFGGRFGGTAQWAALAASLVLGVFVGRFAISEPPLSVIDRGLVASGDLARALDRDLAGGQAAIRIGFSFRSQDGYCRTFQMKSARLGGLACREGPDWRVRLTAPLDTAEADYRMASSATPAPVLAAADELMLGEALDREQEAAARAKGWR